LLRDPEWVTVAASSSSPLNGDFRLKEPLVGPSVFTDVSNVIVFESVYVISVLVSNFASDPLWGPISGKLTLQTPSYELIKIATSHRLDPSLKSQVLVSYGRKSVIDGSISLLRKPTLKGEVIFKSTFSPDMTGSLEHDGNTNLQDFNVSNGVCKFKSIVKPLSMFMFRYPSMAFPPKAALILVNVMVNT
jgi:hypothetical protein